MVGRAEVLTPAFENQFAQELLRSQQGDSEARDRIIAEFRKLGRFADPALQLALRGARQDVKDVAWNLFQQVAAQPPGKTL
jgi:hypothetical protein